jgi:hypothetical protein
MIMDSLLKIRHGIMDALSCRAHNVELTADMRKSNEELAEKICAFMLNSFRASPFLHARRAIKSPLTLSSLFDKLQAHGFYVLETRDDVLVIVLSREVQFPPGICLNQHEALLEDLKQTDPTHKQLAYCVVGSFEDDTDIISCHSSIVDFAFIARRIIEENVRVVLNLHTVLVVESPTDNAVNQCLFDFLNALVDVLVLGFHRVEIEGNKHVKWTGSVDAEETARVLKTSEARTAVDTFLLNSGFGKGIYNKNLAKNLWDRHLHTQFIQLFNFNACCVHDDHPPGIPPHYLKSTRSETEVVCDNVAAEDCMWWSDSPEIHVAEIDIAAFRKEQYVLVSEYPSAANPQLDFRDVFHQTIDRLVAMNCHHKCLVVRAEGNAYRIFDFGKLERLPHYVQQHCFLQVFNDLHVPTRVVLEALYEISNNNLKWAENVMLTRRITLSDCKSLVKTLIRRRYLTDNVVLVSMDPLVLVESACVQGECLQELGSVVDEHTIYINFYRNNMAASRFDQPKVLMPSKVMIDKRIHSA